MTSFGLVLSRILSDLCRGLVRHRLSHAAAAGAYDVVCAVSGNAMCVVASDSRSGDDIGPHSPELGTPYSDTGGSRGVSLKLG